MKPIFNTHYYLFDNREFLHSALTSNWHLKVVELMLSNLYALNCCHIPSIDSCLSKYLAEVYIDLQFTVPKHESVIYNKNLMQSFWKLNRRTLIMLNTKFRE